MRDSGGRAEWTRGITGSVYLAVSDANVVAIDALSPTILYTGDPPMQLLQDDGSHRFQVNVTAHLFGGMFGGIAAKGTLRVTGSWGASKSVPVSLAAADGGAVAISVILQASGVKLWWPRGMVSRQLSQLADICVTVHASLGCWRLRMLPEQGGTQAMYTVSAKFVPAPTTSDVAASVQVTRRIGFRTAYLTTGIDTDASLVRANQQGNGNANPANTVMWRINGAPTVMRGANLIPMESMEGRYVEGQHRQLIKSSADANMNLIRA
jgi:hypothetical protein